MRKPEAGKGKVLRFQMKVVRKIDPNKNSGEDTNINHQPIYNIPNAGYLINLNIKFVSQLQIYNR